MRAHGGADNSGVACAAVHPQWTDKKMALSRSSSWKEHRLANRLECDGAEFSVDLVARKATGVEGWKATVTFLPRGEGSELKIDLPNAPSTADVRRLVSELEGADDRLRELCRRARGA